MGSAVGTVTRMAVAEGVPPSVPSDVELRLTGVEPLPPDVSISAANAETDMAQTITRESARARNFFMGNSFSAVILRLAKIFDSRLGVITG